MADVSESVPHGIEIELAGRPYLVDLRGYRRRTLAALRQQFDSAPEPGEQSLSSEGLWRRSQNDWEGGSGQEYYDDPDSDRKAFFTSQNIDVWTEGELKLLNKSQLKLSTGNTRLHLLDVGEYLYFGDGAALSYSQNPEAGLPSFTPVDVQAGQAAAQPIRDLTTDGAFVYAALSSNGVTRTALGSTSATKVNGYSATLIAYVNGRLVVSDGANLSELTNQGATATSIYDHPNPQFIFTAVVGSQSGIYFGGASGDVSTIYLVTVDNTDGSLQTPVAVAQLPRGEKLQALEAYGGALLIGTNKGFRVATVREDGSLVYGPRVDIANGVEAFASEGEFVWFGWQGYPDYEPTETITPHRSGCGRLNLSRFIAPLVPAYATDLMVGAPGTPLLQPTKSIARFEGRTYFAVSGTGFYGEKDEFAENGHLWSGWVRYGITEDKVVSDVALRHEQMTGSIAADLLTEDRVVTALGASSVNGSLGATIRRQVNIGEAAMLRLTLARGGVSQSPVLKRWTLRALPTPRRIDEVILPVVLRERITYGQGDGQTYYFDTKDEFSRLQSFVGSGEVLEYREGTTLYRVYLDRIEEQPDSWNQNKTFFNGTLVLRLLVVDEE